MYQLTKPALIPPRHLIDSNSKEIATFPKEIDMVFSKGIDMGISLSLFLLNKELCFVMCMCVRFKEEFFVMILFHFTFN